LGATKDEVESATMAAEAALRHTLLVRAQRARTCRRESPVTLRAADGTLIEGVLDLAFRELENGRPVWTVVDFKTDVELAARRADYERQVSLYSAAVTAATGEPARGFLLSV
jgi:ATP-dependent exoDNAse (exonuclease V) beta subunit